MCGVPRGAHRATATTTGTSTDDADGGEGSRTHAGESEAHATVDGSTKKETVHELPRQVITQVLEDRAAEPPVAEYQEKTAAKGRAQTLDPADILREFRRTFQVTAYGVMGVQRSEQGDCEHVVMGPSPDMIILDLAGMRSAKKGPAGANGASGEIYRWLKIDQARASPSPVRKAFKKPLHAKWIDDSGNKVIHVVGPDLRDRDVPHNEALVELATAYAHALLEFVKTGFRTIRLTPISGGIFAGNLLDEMPDIMRGGASSSGTRHPRTRRGHALASREWICVSSRRPSFWIM